MDLLLLTKGPFQITVTRVRGFIRTNEHTGPIPTLDEIAETYEGKGSADYQIFNVVTIIIVT